MLFVAEDLRSSRSMRRTLIALTVTAVATLASPRAFAQEKERAPDAWSERYDHARTDMIEGRVREAESEFRALAAQARTPGERTLALEMARLSAAYVARADANAAKRSARDAHPRDAVRTTDELTLFYTSAFLYGAGTGAWFLLQTRPDTAATATLPFAALTAAPVIAIATIDGYKKLPRGLPHAMSAGLYLGLGEGIWLVGYQHARSARIEDIDHASGVRWAPESTASVLWAGATIGAGLGGIVGGYLPTTPGRVSFVASTTMWSGALTGLGIGAILPDDEYRRENAFLAGGAGYNLGLAGGILGSHVVSPTVARVRLVDLMGIAGGLASAGLYLSLADEPGTRTTEGLAVLGAGAGLAAGWLVTSGMPKDTTTTTPPGAAMIQPTMSAVRGGATLGVGGTL
jgi:hypothetical protein